MQKNTNPAIPAPSFIPCKIEPGMFKNEYAVCIKLSDGKIVSFFADERLIRTNGSKNEGYLSVNVVKNASGELVVLLPTEALETGSRWVQIEPKHIQQHTLSSVIRKSFPR